MAKAGGRFRKWGISIFTEDIQVDFHIQRLVDCDHLMEQFLDAMNAFGSYLGPMFIQLSDNFGPGHFLKLKHFVEHLPSNRQFFVELRHAIWFSEPSNRNALFDLLREHQIGVAISDVSGRRDVLHMELSTPELFLRFVGNGGSYRQSDHARVDQWVERIATWVDKGLEKVYFLAHQHDEVDTPLLAAYIIDRLNRRFGAGLKMVAWKA